MSVQAMLKVERLTKFYPTATGPLTYAAPDPRTTHAGSNNAANSKLPRVFFMMTILLWDSPTSKRARNFVNWSGAAPLERPWRILSASGNSIH